MTNILNKYLLYVWHCLNNTFALQTKKKSIQWKECGSDFHSEDRKKEKVFHYQVELWFV